jgi:DnaK suppressor protein
MFNVLFCIQPLGEADLGPNQNAQNTSYQVAVGERPYAFQRLTKQNRRSQIAGRQISHFRCSLCISALVAFALNGTLVQRPQPSNSGGSVMVHLVLRKTGGLYGRGGTVMNTEMGGVKAILERKEAELVQVLRKRDGIATEKSADQMDEIQYASERDLAIRNVDRESTLLRDVKAALLRIHNGSFGTCIECEWEISPKRLAAVPWASRCIRCQDAADRDGGERTDVSETLANAA